MKIYVILAENSNFETRTVHAYIDKEQAEERLEYLETKIKRLELEGCKTFKTNKVILEQIKSIDNDFIFDLFKTPDNYSLHEVELNCYDN